MGKPKENKKKYEKHVHNRKKGTNFCKECGGEMRNVKYAWNPVLRDYFLVGEDGSLQLDQPLDVETVEDDVKEFIAMKKRFG